MSILANEALRNHLKAHFGVACGRRDFPPDRIVAQGSRRSAGLLLRLYLPREAGGVIVEFVHAERIV